MNFFLKYKRAFLIIGFLAIVALLGYLIYNVFIKPNLPAAPLPAKPSETATTTGQLPPSGAGSAVIPEDYYGPGIITGTGGELIVEKIASGGTTETATVVNSKTLNPTSAGTGSGVQYYNQDDEKFYRIDSSGEAVAMSDKAFHNVSNVIWAPQKEKAIIEYPDKTKILYNFNTKKQVTLPKHWEDFNFSTDGSRIVMKSIGIDPENNWLAIANDDGSGIKPIENIGKNADTVYNAWSPNNQTIAMYTKGVDFNRQEVFFVGQNEENFKSTIVEGRGFDPKWSTAGDKLAYSVYSSDNDLKPLLWVVDAQGDSIGKSRKNLGLETWASKCAFADDKILYCGVPRSLDKGAGLFPELAQNTSDNLYRINIETGEKTLVAVPNGEFNMSSLVITDNGNNLYFTDDNSNLLHKIRLK
jgi:hypothetical protein